MPTVPLGSSRSKCFILGARTGQCAVFPVTRAHGTDGLPGVLLLLRGPGPRSSGAGPVSPSRFLQGPHTLAKGDLVGALAAWAGSLLPLLLREGPRTSLSHPRTAPDTARKAEKSVFGTSTSHATADARRCGAGPRAGRRSSPGPGPAPRWTARRPAPWPAPAAPAQTAGRGDASASRPQGSAGAGGRSAWLRAGVPVCVCGGGCVPRTFSVG